MCEGGGSVTVIDGASDSLVRTMPVGAYPLAVTCNPAQNRVYVANWWTNSVSVIRDSVVVGMGRACAIDRIAA